MSGKPEKCGPSEVGGWRWDCPDAECTNPRHFYEESEVVPCRICGEPLSAARAGLLLTLCSAKCSRVAHPAPSHEAAVAAARAALGIPDVTP